MSASEWSDQSTVLLTAVDFDGAMPNTFSVQELISNYIFVAFPKPEISVFTSDGSP